MLWHVQESTRWQKVDTSFAMLQPSEAAPQETPEMSRFLPDLGMILRCDRKFDVNFTPTPMYTFILLIPEVFFCARNFCEFLFPSKHGRPWFCAHSTRQPVKPLARFRVGDRVTARVPMKISHEGRGYFNEVSALKIAAEHFPGAETVIIK